VGTSTKTKGNYLKKNTESMKNKVSSRPYAKLILSAGRGKKGRAIPMTRKSERCQNGAIGVYLPKKPPGVGCDPTPVKKRKPERETDLSTIEEPALESTGQRKLLKNRSRR